MNIFPNAEKIFKNNDKKFLTEIIPKDPKFLKLENLKELKKISGIANTHFFKLLYVTAYCTEQQVIEYFKKKENIHLLDHINSFEKKYGLTPLIVSIIARKNLLLEYFLENKANPDQCDICKWTALMHAAVRHNKTAIELLLKYNADPEKKNFFDGTYMDISRITTLKLLKNQKFSYHSNIGIHEEAGKTFVKFMKNTGALHFLGEENYFPGYFLFERTWQQIVSTSESKFLKNLYDKYKLNKPQIYLIQKPGKRLSSDQYGIKTLFPVLKGNLVCENYIAPIAPKDKLEFEKLMWKKERLTKILFNITSQLFPQKLPFKDFLKQHILKNFEFTKKGHFIFNIPNHNSLLEQHNEIISKLKNLNTEINELSQYRINNLVDGLRFRCLAPRNGFPNVTMICTESNGMIRYILMAIEDLKAKKEVITDHGMFHPSNAEEKYFSKISELKKITSFVKKNGGLIKILTIIKYPLSFNKVNDVAFHAKLRYIISSPHIIIYLLMEQFLSPEDLKFLLKQQKLEKLLAEFLDSDHWKILKDLYENTLIEIYKKIARTLNSSKNLKNKIFEEIANLSFSELYDLFNDLKKQDPRKFLKQYFKNPISKSKNL